MEKINLDKYKDFKPSQESGQVQLPHQEYALKVCELFKITGKWKNIVFFHAKHNRSWLEGKATWLEELKGTPKYKDLERRGMLGNYLIGMLNKDGRGQRKNTKTVGAVYSRPL